MENSWDAFDSFIRNQFEDNGDAKVGFHWIWLREGAIAFPQCIASSELYRLSLLLLVMKDALVIRSRPNLAF